MKFLFIFMDGVGLGTDDPAINPFARAKLPTMESLLNGHKILLKDSDIPKGTAGRIIQTDKSTLIPLDACLGVDGLPQSATGQASILTGKNVAALLSMHEGPKPNPPIMEILKMGTLFSSLLERDKKATLLNAYPPRYFKSIESGHRLPGVIALSAMYAQIRLRTKEDLYQGEAISADFTARGWREHLGFHDAPLLDLPQVGRQIADLSKQYALSFLEHWQTDVVGHHREMDAACELLEQIDAILRSMIEHWDADEGMILITSDHGNIEDLSVRHHNRNDVPLILISSLRNRELFTSQMDQSRGSRNHYDLTDIAPAILNLA